MLGKITLKRVVSLIGREADKYQNNSIKYFAVTKFAFFYFLVFKPVAETIGYEALFWMYHFLTSNEWGNTHWGTDFIIMHESKKDNFYM